ncbi:aldehyde dehydrogenase family protein, partial [Mycobacterium tuberculosis]|nr:aldehyde dehydrogenase family protein [Mycobacterium tuberculosis]
VLVGTPPGEQGVSSVGAVHTIAARHGRAALAVVQGARLVMVVSGHLGDSYASPFLADLLASVFPPDRVAVVQGGADVAAAVSSLPLDHLLFTGSTAVGRKVMAAAAEHLV